VAIAWVALAAVVGTYVASLLWFALEVFRTPLVDEEERLLPRNESD
jgi:hypothetical protein